jgi:hypothetical protein
MNATENERSRKGEARMNWHDYIACFFAGMFLANVVPHFVHGISGDRFPTPFANPPGKGLSSPTVNVLWALLNLAVGYVLLRAGKVSSGNVAALAIFFAGIVVISTLSSVRFAKKQAK